MVSQLGIVLLIQVAIVGKAVQATRCFKCSTCPDPFMADSFNVDKITCKLDNSTTTFLCKVSMRPSEPP